MEPEILTIAGLLFGNLAMSGAIYFRLGSHSARLDGQDRRISKLEGKPLWTG